MNFSGSEPAITQKATRPMLRSLCADATGVSIRQLARRAIFARSETLTLPRSRRNRSAAQEPAAPAEAGALSGKPGRAAREFAWPPAKAGAVPRANPRTANSLKLHSLRSLSRFDF